MQAFAHTTKGAIGNSANTHSVPDGEVVLAGFPLPWWVLGCSARPRSAHGACADAPAVLRAAALAQGRGEPQAVWVVLASLPPIASLGRVPLPGGELVCTRAPA